MAVVVVDTSHHCEGGGDHVGGAIPVQQFAQSSCHGAILAEGGTPETGFHCTECGEPCERVLSELTAKWTCHCGTVRTQVVTQPVDEEA